MEDFDLSIITDKRRVIKLQGKEIAFKSLSVEEHLNSEFDAQELDQFHIRTRKDITKLGTKIAKYLKTILDITDEDAKKITMNEYRNLRKYMSRLDMYDQGFTDREIDELEKKAAFRVIQEATE
jgi:hypothetical protein